MKHIVIILLISLSTPIFCQNISFDTKIDLKYNFITDWVYFRMQKNPLLPYEETHDERGGWTNPFKFHRSFFDTYMVQDLKISRWVEDGYYTDLKGKEHFYVDFIEGSRFYIAEKRNGLPGVKRYAGLKGEELLPDSTCLDIYNELFPYDNRFLAVDKGNNQFTFHSGNVLWGEWRDIGFIHDVDVVGLVRGVQFGVERVRPFIWEESQAIRRLRPEYPDYVYAHADRSLLSSTHLLIAAPQGKEDQLVEFIYYTNKPEKTGDENLEHFYEMRYILPTEIKSIKERRLEKRLLSDKEKEMILSGENDMIYFVDPLRVIEPDEIIEVK